MAYSDNLDEVLRSYDRELPTRRYYLLQVINRADYARFLHDREGYSVLSDRLALTFVENALKRLVTSGRPISDDAIEQALKDASDAYVGHIQERTSRLRPPIRSGGPKRPAHPKPYNWADRTTELASSYERTVNGQHRKAYDYDGPVYASPDDD